MNLQSACPKCQQPLTDTHCGSPTCSWAKCRRCHAVVDIHGQVLGEHRGTK